MEYFIHVCTLLRDRLFKISTDHRNLLFIKEASNSMIVRWYMALSEFSFTLKFSALKMISQMQCLVYVETTQEYSEEHILSAISASTKPNAERITVSSPRIGASYSYQKE